MQLVFSTAELFRSCLAAFSVFLLPLKLILILLRSHFPGISPPPKTTSLFFTAYFVSTWKFTAH